MEDKPRKDHSEASSAIYQITIKGEIDSHWVEWFNGAAISLTYGSDALPKTILMVQLRDQSELLGMLNRLHGFNLLILQVVLTGSEGGNHVANG